MTRFLLWLLGGVVLGGIIHLIVILTLPLLDEETVWTRLEAIGVDNSMVILPTIAAGQANPLGLDPEVIYGLCRLDLAQGPGYLRGVLPDAPWSVALFNAAGLVTYSTTNRDGIGQTLDLGIFNAAQTRLLAQQQLDVAEGVLVVESASDSLFAVVRLLPPHQAMRARFADMLAQASCGNRG
ncbi:DUF1254 domain-containing protein [Devosia beringensis]|uniref:DUF1254 domain-containing protein n=1 Tax=Devosia beringensis TaxID=2657486 RepID=UPI00186B7A05|nr:hypothetical protein [Devosia beringensis]